MSNSGLFRCGFIAAFVVAINCGWPAMSFSQKQKAAKKQMESKRDWTGIEIHTNR